MAGVALVGALWFVPRSDGDQAVMPSAQVPVCADFPAYISQCERVIRLAQDDIATLWLRHGYNAAPFDIELTFWPDSCLGYAVAPPCEAVVTPGFNLQFPISVLESVEYHTDMGSRVALAGGMTVDF